MDVRVLEKETAGEFVVLLVERAAGDEYPDFHTGFAVSFSPLDADDITAAVRPKRQVSPPAWICSAGLPAVTRTHPVSGTYGAGSARCAAAASGLPSHESPEEVI